MIELLEGIEPHWGWVTLGLVLASLEMLVPGVYLIWLAVAAVITGGLTGLLGLSLPFQIINFVFLAILAVFSARRYLHDKPMESPDPMLNDRGGQLIGQTARVVEAIEHGRGRVHVGDTEWTAKGTDAAIGDSVCVTGSEGTVLLVEKI